MDEMARHSAVDHYRKAYSRASLRQRSAEEYDGLAEQCDFKRTGAIDTPAGISILEYERV